MHAAMLHLTPILGAEKSKTAFYVAGGLLVAWALIVSVGLGMRRADFPAEKGGQSAVIAITALLVIATAATAVITAGGSAASTSTSSAAASEAAASSTSSTSAPATSSTAAGAQPTATTGTPPPASSPAAAPSAPLQLAANPEGQLSYSTKALAAKAGKVTIDFANASPLAHNVVIAQGSKVLGQTPIKMGSSTLSVALKPGAYKFYCAVPGHRQAGMEGTLTVS